MGRGDKLEVVGNNITFFDESKTVKNKHCEIFFEDEKLKVKDNIT